MILFRPKDARHGMIGETIVIVAKCRAHTHMVENACCFVFEYNPHAPSIC
jgi:hypothetical protein